MPAMPCNLVSRVSRVSRERHANDTCKQDPGSPLLVGGRACVGSELYVELHGKQLKLFGHLAFSKCLFMIIVVVVEEVIVIFFLLSVVV